MKHTTRTYFIEKVIPSYEIFVNYYNKREFGLRKDTFNAGNIAESLRDIPEHIFTEIGVAAGHKNAYKYRESMSDKNSHYKIVCDLANAIKHREISKNNPSFLSLDDVKESVATVRYSDILGKYYRTRKLLEVTLLDKSIHDIGDLLHKSILLWSNQLIILGLIPAIPKFPELLPKFARRNDIRFKDNIHMLGFVGEYFETQLRALIYRKSTNTITEVATGEKFGTSDIPVTMKIDKSPFE